MTKAEFIQGVASKMGATTKEGAKAVDAVIEQLTELFNSGDKLSIPNFGTFSVAAKNAKQGINPKTGERIEIPAKKVPKFKASDKLVVKA